MSESLYPFAYFTGPDQRDIYGSDTFVEDAAISIGTAGRKARREYGGLAGWRERAATRRERAATRRVERQQRRQARRASHAPQRRVGRGAAIGWAIGGPFGALIGALSARARQRRERRAARERARQQRGLAQAVAQNLSRAPATGASAVFGVMPNTVEVPASALGACCGLGNVACPGRRYRCDTCPHATPASLGSYRTARGTALIPDYRGESFYPSEDVPDYRTAIQQPSQVAGALARIAGSGDAPYGQLPRGRRRREAQKYAQQAAMMLWNPTLPASERPALLEQLRAIGAPAGGTSDAVARTLSFGPAAIGAPVGLYGSRRR